MQTVKCTCLVLLLHFVVHVLWHGKIFHSRYVFMLYVPFLMAFLIFFFVCDKTASSSVLGLLFSQGPEQCCSISDCNIIFWFVGGAGSQFMPKLSQWSFFD